MKFAITSGGDIDCNAVDFVIRTTNSPTKEQCVKEAILNDEEPFSEILLVKFGVLLIVIDPRLTVMVPDSFSAAPDFLRVLIVKAPPEGWKTPSAWLIDHEIHIKNNHIDSVFDTRDFPVIRPISVRLGSCEGLPPVPFLSANVLIKKMLGELVTVCFVQIDAQIAHFDSQIQWLQANLAEQPCRESDFVVVSLGSSSVDSEVVDLLESHSLVDLVTSGNGMIEFKPSGEFRFSNNCDRIEGESVQSKREKRISDYPSPAVFSDTDVRNILFSVAVALVSGLSVNVAFRRAIVKQVYEIII